MNKKKKKFKPTITRVKLNPEQAVLSCACHDGGHNSFVMFFNSFESFAEVCAGKFTFTNFGYAEYESGSSYS